MEIPGWRTGWQDAALLLAAAVGVVWILGWLDPALQYRGRLPVFYLEWSYGRDFLLRTGGAVAWLTALLLQWYSSPWVAVLTTAVVVGMCGWGASAYLAALGGPLPRYLSLVTLAPLVALQSCYYSPALEFSLRLALTWGVLAAYTRWLPSLRRGQVAVVWGLSILVYYLAGGVLLLLAVLGVLFELRAPQPRWRLALAWVAGAAGIPFTVHLFTGAGSLGAAYLQGFWVRPFALVAVLHATAVAIAAWASLRSWRHRRTRVGGTERWFGWILAMGLVLGAAWITLNPHRRALLRVDHHARRQEWSAVLAQVPDLDLSRVRPHQIPAALITAFVDVRRAQYHMGRLSEDLFSLPCPAGMPLLPNTGQGFYWCLPASELLLELGHVNYAEHWAHEALEIKGELPEVLKTLATVNQLLDRPEAARVFLNRLARNPAHAAEARRRLARLEQDPRGEHDPALEILRTARVRSDSPSGYLDAETLLQTAWAASPRNRMAYEYLVAHHLLGRQVEPAVRLIEQSADLGFTNLPRHWQEARLLYDRLQSTHSPTLPSPVIQPAVRERFEIFEERTARFRNDRSGLRLALAADQADTFWFYYLFGETPGRKAGSAANPRP